MKNVYPIIGLIKIKGRHFLLEQISLFCKIIPNKNESYFFQLRFAFISYFEGKFLRNNKKLYQQIEKNKKVV